MRIWLEIEASHFLSWLRCARFLSHGSFADKIVNKLREITGYKVINLNVNYYDKFHSDKVIWDGGARDFVGLIKNAEFVCTNSFHGTAFSIVFRKNFVSIVKKRASARLQSLQTTLGLGDRFVSEESWEEWVSNVTPEMINVNYESLEDRIQNKIEDSIRYLKEALNEKGN